jgi:hypothetical protein
MRKEQDMSNQEKPVPQLVQEANEDLAILDEELLNAVTGGGGALSCLTCASGKNEAQAHVAPSSPSFTSSDLITNEHGAVAALHEVFPIWEKENPASPGIPGSQQPINWSPRKATLPNGQTGYVRSPGGSLDGFRI